MRREFAVIGVLAGWLVLGAGVPRVSADGGMVRASERRGDHLITAFTASTPLPSGLVDVSVLIQDAQSGKPVSGVPVRVRARRLDRSQAQIDTPATTEAATNKLFQAAALNLAAGRWHVDIVVDESRQAAPIGFDIEVAEALAPWAQTGLWIGWPAVVILFFVVHQLLAARRRRGDA